MTRRLKRTRSPRLSRYVTPERTGEGKKVRATIDIHAHTHACAHNNRSIASLRHRVTPLRIPSRGVPRANIRRRSSSVTRIPGNLAGIVRGSLSDVQARGSRSLGSTLPFVSFLGTPRLLQEQASVASPRNRCGSDLISLETSSPTCLNCNGALKIDRFLNGRRREDDDER